MKQLLKTLVILTVILPGLFLTTRAQDLKYCGTTDMQVRLWEEFPELLKAQEEYDIQVRDYAASHATERDAQIYIIPVVFHVIHNYGSEDISDAQVEDQVRVLNEDYRKLNADTAAIVNAFLGIAGDAQIEFRLAKKTPGGGCTNGIDRIVSHETFQGDDGSKLSQWPRNMYLNVWCVKQISSGAAGYAYFPSSVQGFNTPIDGIMILSDYIGSIGTGSITTTRALTHEIGHYLNLPHTWGLTNSPGVDCGDDGVFDTPLTEGWTSCNLSGSICTPGVIENVQNYMEYAYCSKMFTEGQGAIMRGVLNNPVSDRNNLWTETNLINTGTNDGYESSCAPRADFNPDHYNICQGADIHFNDFSWGGEITNWQWDLPGGTPSVSTDQSPVVIFDELGKHTVTLTVTGPNGSSTISKDIYVSSTTAQYAHYYYESFEDPAVVANDWILRNVDNNQSEWSNASYAGYTGSHSMLIDNYYGDKGDVDYMISPSMDLTGMPEVNLSFHYAGASSTSNVNNMNDVLRIYASSNCGETWMLRGSFDGIDLINNGAWGTAYKPNSSSNNWSVGSLQLPLSLATSNVRFKFEFTGGSLGNNFYLDDVTISEHPVGINSPSGEVASLNIFPNPSNGEFMVTYNLPKESLVKISLLDLAGRELSQIVNESEAAGNHQQLINTSSLKEMSTGIYILRIETDGQSYIRKIVIE